MKIDTEQRAIVRSEVRRLLDRTPAFRQLPSATQTQLERDMTRVATAIAVADDPRAAASDVAGTLAAGHHEHPAAHRLGDRIARRPTAGHMIDRVDFPGFVAGLIQGTFQAVVDASVKQMQAYGELVASVSRSLDDFVDRDDDDDD